MAVQSHFMIRAKGDRLVRDRALPVGDNVKVPNFKL